MERVRCRAEIETTPLRQHIRLAFMTEDGLLVAGVLTLEPATWQLLKESIQAWADVDEKIVRDVTVWFPEVVARLAKVVPAIDGKCFEDELKGEVSD